MVLCVFIGFFYFYCNESLLLFVILYVERRLFFMWIRKNIDLEIGCFEILFRISLELVVGILCCRVRRKKVLM